MPDAYNVEADNKSLLAVLQRTLDKPAVSATDRKAFLDRMAEISAKMIADRWPRTTGS